MQMANSNTVDTVPSARNDRFLYVFISLGLTIALYIFSADSVLGAVGLRAWYNLIGVVAATASLLLIPYVLAYRRFSRTGRYIYLLIMVCFLLLAIGLRLPLVVVGWFTIIATGAGWIPTATIAILFTVLLGIQFVLSRLSTKASTRIAQLLILAQLVYSVGYFFGVAALPRYAESEIRDRKTYNDHQYFLYLWFGWLGDPDYLALYECNSIGLFCRVTYEAPTGYYGNSQLAIATDPQTQAVGVQIDSLFSPRELTESDVAYLCMFFHIPEKDQFCANPFSQDYDSFWWMLRRNVADDLNYSSIVPYFELTRDFTETTCPPPDTVLSSEQPSFTCQLHFPESDLLLELHMYESSDDSHVSYNMELVNPNCNCNNH